jgi:hypothetical protein
MEAAMRGIFAIAAAVVAFGAIDALAADPNGRPVTDQPTPVTAPPLSGTASSDLARSGGVITPPPDVDPQMKRAPSHSADPMPIIPPPGTPGGDPSVKPK